MNKYIKCKTGSKSNGKPYYLVSIVNYFTNGKHFTKGIFVSKETYDYINNLIKKGE